MTKSIKQIYCFFHQNTIVNLPFQVQRNYVAYMKQTNHDYMYLLLKFLTIDYIEIHFEGIPDRSS